MINFDTDVLPLVHSCGYWEAFEDDEAEAYFNILNHPDVHSTIMEIGLQYGRSTAVAASVAKDRKCNYVGVDPFIDPPDAHIRWTRLMEQIGIPYTLYKMKSSEVYRRSLGQIDCLLVDGDHTAEGATHDLNKFMPLISIGGWLCIHDWGRTEKYPGMSAVYPIMKAAKDTGLWSFWGQWGTLAIWRKGKQ